MPSRRSNNVVIVDDEKPVADAIAAILRKSGYTPYVAYCVEKALLLLDSITPQFLITDVMPSMKGIELALEVKRRHPRCRVFLTSETADYEDSLEVAARQGQQFTFLYKPVQAEELLRSIV